MLIKNGRIHTMAAAGTIQVMIIVNGHNKACRNHTGGYSRAKWKNCRNR